MAEAKKLKVIGTDWCGDCKWIKYVLDNQKVQYEYIDSDKNEEAKKIVLEASDGAYRIPVIVFPSGKKLVEPHVKDLHNVLVEEGLL